MVDSVIEEIEAMIEELETNSFEMFNTDSAKRKHDAMIEAKVDVLKDLIDRLEDF